MLKKLFVLDTNVIIQDPLSIFSFQEHDVYIPLIVLEELDNHKKGTSDEARNVREALRIFDSIITQKSVVQIMEGLPLWECKKVNHQATGLIFFEVKPALTEGKADNIILESCKKLSSFEPTLVTKDINLRIKATAIGIKSEDYLTDHAIEDADLIRTGIHTIESDYFGNDLMSWVEGGDTFYRVAKEPDMNFCVNDCLMTQNAHGFQAIVEQDNSDHYLLKFPRSYFKQDVWGMKARNQEQNFALNFLMNPEIDLVTLLGAAGTGKTMLALASALEQVINQKRYDEIIVTRATIPMGDDIGFLPGTEEEKMLPWMGAIHDNIQALLRHDSQATKPQKDITTELVSQKINIKSMAFMRGRTFQRKFIIIDEAQNLTTHQIKSLITRVGEGSKIVCIGNISQIDTPYISPTTSGLTHLVELFKCWSHAAHITLQKGERSRLASYAQEVF